MPSIGLSIRWFTARVVLFRDKMIELVLIYFLFSLQGHFWAPEVYFRVKKY